MGVSRSLWTLVLRLVSTRHGGYRRKRMEEGTTNLIRSRFDFLLVLATGLFTRACYFLIVSDGNVESTEQNAAAENMKNYVNVFINL